MARIAIFGGSFNPPTILHVLSANYVLASKLVEEVWFLPNASHPFRDSQVSKSNLLPFDVRVQMLKDTISWCGSGDHVFVSRFDEINNLGGYAAATLEVLHRQNDADVAFYWVLGMDCVHEFPKWARIDDLLNNERLIILTRQGVPDAVDSPYWPLIQKRHTILQTNLPEGSSTAARANPDGGLLAPLVAEHYKMCRDLL